MELFKDKTLQELTDQINSMMLMDGMAVDTRTGEAVTADIFSQLNAAYEDKVSAYIAYIKDLKAKAEAHKAEAKKQKDIADRQMKNAAWLMGNLKANLKGKKWDCTVGSVTYRETPPRVVICDEEAIPDKWGTEKVTIGWNLEDMRKAMLAGEEIPGAKLESEVRMYVK